MKEISSLEQSINQFWILCRSRLSSKHFDFGNLPEDLSELIHGYADKKKKQKDVRIVKSVSYDGTAESENGISKIRDKHAKEILKLFDASSNAYRSVTNVLLEYLKLQRSLDRGAYDLEVSRFALIDGIPLIKLNDVDNVERCPVCNRYPQEDIAFALITGSPQTDSGYQTYRNKQTKRGSLAVCRYCFTAGWIDLPTAKIVKDGQNVGKGREYLFVTTPLSKKRLERLLELIAHYEIQDPVVDEEEDPSPEKTDSSLDAFTQLLCDELDIELRDPLSVLGLSQNRLRELRGFVLQSANLLQRTLVLRAPIERIVGEDKVSGAVRRELVKATMYDFWRITGGSLHYNRIRDDVQFSIDGHTVSHDEILRANLAYRVADRHGRVGRYRHLSSGLLMLLLTHPRQAANRMLRTKKRHRRGRYAPATDGVKEIISMIEEINIDDDWQFLLGLEIVEILVESGMAPRAKGFWKNKQEQYTGVELVKWIQRIKMIHDPDSARAWGTSLINGYRREHNAGPNAKIVGSILALVEKIIATCDQQETPLVEFSRTTANMDYYLLFYYNQKRETKEN